MGDGRGLGFGTVAEQYDRYRPDPPEALGDLLEVAGLNVLELGAGTGKLTRLLLALGAKVTIIEPDADMRRVALRRSPDVLHLDGRAESIPAADATYDAVLSSSAWHWFPQPGATLEIARVLREDATLYVLWNGFSRDVEWVAELATLRERPEDRAKRPRVWSVRFNADEPFVDEHDLEINWTWQRSIDEVVATFPTYSGAIVQGDEQRAAMAQAVRRMLTERFGDGPAVLPMTLRGTIARRRAR